MVKIAVLGSGLMGIKIAGEFAYHGHRVKLYDHNVSVLNTAYLRMEDDKKQLREEGLLLQKNFIGPVLLMSRLEETVRDAELIIECVPDDMEVKKDLFERVSHLCKASTVIGSNTLRVDVTKMVERTTGKERTLGLRFLFPVYYIPEVEITPNKFTSAETIEKVRAILEKMGKTLFFRSGNEPLILSEEQRDERKKIRVEQIRNNSGVGNVFDRFLPSLTQQTAGGHGGGIPSTPPTQNRNSGHFQDGDTDCAICMDRPRDCVLRPCHHMVTCYDCAGMLINRRDGCPICRKDIIEIIRVYTA